MRRRALPAAALLAVLLLGGCTAGGADSEAGGGVSQPLPAVPAEDGGGPGGWDSGGGESGVGDDVDGDREVITSGSMTVTVADPLSAADEAAAIAEGAGGRVDGRDEQAPREDGDAGRAVLTLRVPAERLSDAVEALEELGEVERFTTSAMDVTREVQDLDVRIEAARASVDRLLALLATATDTTALVEIESALASRQSELESMLASRRHLADLVAMSTLTVTLQSPADAPAEEPRTFVDGLVAGWESLLGFGAGALVVIGALLPWAVVLGLLAAGLVFALRRRRRRDRSPDEPSSM